MASVIVTRVLKNLGTNVLIFYGAVMNLDSSIVEAARIDGRKRLQAVQQNQASAAHAYRVDGFHRHDDRLDARV